MKEENKIKIKENSGINISKNEGTIYTGISYTEIKNICSDLIKNALCEYKDKALEIAQMRNKELLDRIFDLLKAKISEEDIKKAFTKPSMQFDYVEAQKSYIKSGSKDLLDVLSEILVKRISCDDNTLIQIALSESIKNCNLLLNKHMALLALIFITCYAKRKDLVNLKLFEDYINNIVIPLYKMCSNSQDCDMQHINYTSCGSTSDFSFDINERIREGYSGLFLKGSTNEDIEKFGENSLLESFPTFFTKCLHDNNKYQISYIDVDLLKIKLKEHGCSDEIVRVFEKEFEKEKMTSKEVSNYLVSFNTEWLKLEEFWKKSGISNIRLTSVGIIIGAMFYKKNFNSDVDLSIWIK